MTFFHIFYIYLIFEFIYQHYRYLTKRDEQIDKEQRETEINTLKAMGCPVVDYHGSVNDLLKEILEQDRHREIRPVPYRVMYEQVKTSQGMSPEEVERAWRKFCGENDGLAAWSELQLSARMQGQCDWHSDFH